MATQSGQIASEGTTQALCNIVWSFAIAGYLGGKNAATLASTLWNRAITPEFIDAAHDDELRQLYQFLVFSKIEASELKLADPPSNMVDAVAKMNIDVTISHSQQEVSDCMNKAGM